MGTIPAPALLKQWKQETLTVEMAIGHLLQHVVQMQADIETGQHRRTTMQQISQANSVNWANLKIEVEDLASLLQAIKANQIQLRHDVDQLLALLDSENIKR